MTIDDELLLELIKPNKLGEVGVGALIVNVVGTKNIKYRLEEPTDYQTLDDAVNRRWSIMTPDITVTLPKEGRKQITIELENDVQWDFQASLRQVKNYQQKFDTRVIIPEKYKRFAPLYKNEGFRVYLWKAKRKWQCLRCDTITVNESLVPPQCENQDCNNKRREEFDLVGLNDADVYEYE